MAVLRDDQVRYGLVWLAVEVGVQDIDVPLADKGSSYGAAYNSGDAGYKYWTVLIHHILTMAEQRKTDIYRCRSSSSTGILISRAIWRNKIGEISAP